MCGQHIIGVERPSNVGCARSMDSVKLIEAPFEHDPTFTIRVIHHQAS
jgi:hypothetical protein